MMLIATLSSTNSPAVYIETVLPRLADATGVIAPALLKIPGAVTQLPKPPASVKVTVGGVEANVVFAGNPWLVGIAQVNFEVPHQVHRRPL